MAVIQMTDDRFEEVVLKSELPVMVDYVTLRNAPAPLENMAL